MTHIATIPKNTREELRVTLEEYRGHHIANLRVWYDVGDGEMRPGKQGLALRLDLLGDLQSAITATEKEARRAGLMETAA